MNLVQRVVFTYDIGNNVLHTAGTFSTVDELKRGIAKFNCTIPCDLYVERKIQTIDTDVKTEESADAEIFGISPRDSSVKAETSTNKLHFTVVDKLWFKDDVRKALKKEYGKTFDLNKLVLNNNIPITSFYVIENSFTGMVVKGCSTHYAFHHLHCTPATKRDIIVNKNLEQLWFQHGGVPSVLTDLLSQTKVNIKEA